MESEVFAVGLTDIIVKPFNPDGLFRLFLQYLVAIGGPSTWWVIPISGLCCIFPLRKALVSIFQNKLKKTPKESVAAVRQNVKSGLSEKELIQQLQQGHEPSFRLLVDTYRNRVYHTVLNIIQDADEANDAAQDVFIGVYESIKTFNGQSSLSTWIYRIAVNSALDKLRRRKARRRLQHWLPWWMPDEKKSQERLFYHPGIELDNKEKAAVLFKAVSALPEKQRLAFTLVKIQGLPYAEAAAVLQQTVKAIESLTGRASKNLQAQLQTYYQENIKSPG